MGRIKKLNELTRNPDEYGRETKFDKPKVHRNYDPDYHPLQLAKEYKQALNAVKLERTFAKPFVGDLPHAESLSVVATHPQDVSALFSATLDGRVHLWDARQRKQRWSGQAHTGPVYAVTPQPDGAAFYTVGNDKAIKRWDYSAISDACDTSDVFRAAGDANSLCEPVNTWTSPSVVSSLAHHPRKEQFVTCGERVQLWSPERRVPLSSLDWSATKGEASCSAITARFSPVEHDTFASCDANNALVLYDLRAGMAVAKLKFKLRLNDLCWNPMEAFHISLASDDYNCYTYDVRNLDVVTGLLHEHRGHTRAVTCLDYSPTGKEIVTGSHDRTVRIFPADGTRSRDMYHTARMHRVNSVQASRCSKFLFSGSADHNVRIWKMRAAEKLGPMSRREQDALSAAEELKRKYHHLPDIARIARHRHRPRHIMAATKEHFMIRSSRKRKEVNVREHSAPGTKVGETDLEKPVFGLQDEPDFDEEKEAEEIKELEEHAKKRRREARAERKARREEKEAKLKDSKPKKGKKRKRKSDE